MLSHSVAVVPIPRQQTEDMDLYASNLMIMCDDNHPYVERRGKQLAALLRSGAIRRQPHT